MIKTNLNYIVVGLGNFGQEYNMTRHNMGYMVLDKISDRWDFSFSKEKFESLINKVKIFDKTVMFMKPLTYMNNSGYAVAKAVNFYKVSMKNVIVVYDDITLDLGNIKIRSKGTAGGHNGIKSVINLTERDDFIRVKVGISGKPNKDYDLADWVLSKFKIEDKESLERGIDLASKAVEMIIKDSVDKAMNTFNMRT